MMTFQENCDNGRLSVLSYYLAEQEVPQEIPARPTTPKDPQPHVIDQLPTGKNDIILPKIRDPIPLKEKYNRVMRAYYYNFCN